MRTVNVRLFVSLVAGFLLLALTTVVVHRLQAGNIAQGLLFQADQADKDERPDLCARYLFRYLEFVPDDTDSRARLGQTLAHPRLAMSHRAREKARYVMEQVLIREPGRHELRCRLVKLALDDGHMELAQEQLKILQKECPGDGQVAGLAGLLLERQGKDTAALEQLRRAVAQAPDNVETLVRLAAILRKLDGGVKGQRFQEAEQCVARALSKAPQDLSVLLAAAELAQDRNDLARARSLVREALKKNERDVRVHLALARIELLDDARDGAVAVLKRAMPIVPAGDRFELRWMLANVYVDAGKFDEARDIMSRLEPGSPQGAADYIAARTRIARGQFFESARSLEQIRNSFKGAPALTLQVDLLLAHCYERLEEPARQLAASQRVVEADPANVHGRRSLANALLALGRPDEALRQQQLLIKVNQDRKAPEAGRIDLVRLMLFRNLQSETRDWRTFEDELLAAEKENPNSLDLVLIRAEMCAARNRFDDAKLVLTTALAQHARKAEVWTAMARLLDKNNERDKALEIVQQAEQNLGDLVDLRLARARIWSKQEGKEPQARIVSLESNLQKFSQADRDRLLQGLAEIQQRARNFAEAERLWRTLAAQPTQAKDIRLRLVLFDLALEAGDDAKMQKVLAEIKDLEAGESVLWNYGQAARRIHLAKQGQKQLLPEARTLLEKVATQRPSWPPLILAKAELELLQGNPDQAVVHYRRAVDQGVRSPQVIRQFVQLLASQQRYEEAETALRRLRQQAPLSGDLQKLAIAVAVNNDDFARAEQQVRAMVPPDSRDYRDRLWLGQVLSAGKRVSPEAERELRKAVELAPTAPEAWVALVQFLAGIGRKSDAEAEIKIASEKLTSAVGQLALAQCYESVERLDLARERVQAAMEAGTNDINVRRAGISFYLRTGSPGGAEAWLRELVDRKLPISDDDHRWARRSLALTLATTADYRRYIDALVLLGLSLDARGQLVETRKEDCPEEQIARARVLALQQSRQLRSRAIAWLEDVMKHQALGADDQMLLARLYLEQGREAVWWGKARELMLGLVNAHPRSPTYLVPFIQALLDRDDLNEAGRQLAKLEQLERSRQAPLGSFGTVELRVRWLEKRGKVSEAVAAMKQYAEDPKGPPQRMLLLAGLHGRLGQIKEAIDICEHCRATCAPEAVGGASVALVRAATDSDRVSPESIRQQSARVEKWLQEVIGRFPKNVVLRLQLADLYDIQGRARDGEAVYRELLTLDPHNYVALNNLAWLLAQDAARAEEGLQYINRAIQVHGPRPGFLDTRAVVYLGMNRVDQALADLERAVADAPTPSKYWHLTRAHHQARNPRAALAALNQAHESGLTVQRLHPAERDTYRRLTAELKQ